MGKLGPVLKSLLMSGGLFSYRVHAREASNSGETMKADIFTSGCSSEESDSQTL